MYVVDTSIQLPRQNSCWVVMLGCNAVFYPGAVMDEKHGEKKGDRPRLLPDSWGEIQ